MREVMARQYLALLVFLPCLVFSETFYNSHYYPQRSRQGQGDPTSTNLDPVLLDSPVFADPETVPHGAASLAFVFDITGSMYDDLVQVIEGAARILATTLARRDKPLYNYVLVPFHDPEVGPVMVTTDPDKFQEDLRDLYVQGGGDCPEMSITAIKQALQVSLPNSFIYVFTDARAKDYHLTEAVLTLIQHKQSQVVFVMTGDCGDNSHDGYKAYEQIASTSSGQIFLLKKSQVNQVLNFVRVAVQSRKVNLMSVDRDYDDAELVYKLPVDSKLQEFTISVSGERAEVTIIDPNGNKVTPHNGLNTLLTLKNALILNVKDPKPGVYTLKISAMGPHTVRVTGLSVLDFMHGFSPRPTLYLGETESRPMKGIPTYLLINATSLDFPGRVSRIELLDLHGDTLLEIPIHYYESRPSLYNVSSFVPPNKFFYIKVVGIDQEGHDFQRTTATAISAMEPDVPVVLMAPVTRGFFNEEAVVTCSVSSHVPYSVQWFRDGEPVGNRLFFVDNSNVTWSIPGASSVSEGYYTCNASNAAGYSSSSTYLDVKDPPPTIIRPADVTVLPGRDAILTCIATSTVEFNMTWFRHDGEGNSQHLPLKPNAQLLSNGSLLIRNVGIEDEGTYVCRASNEGGHSEDVAWLIVHKAPTVTVEPATQKFATNNRVMLKCKAAAYPPASFSWRRHSGHLASSDRVRYDSSDGSLVIEYAERADEGQWECVAVNTMGEGRGIGNLEYIQAPSIKARQKTVLVNAGDRATMACRAEGIPAPNITWHRKGIEELSFLRITLDGELSITGTQEVDGGEYECVAVNEAGTSKDVVVLEVGSPPVITRAPQSRGVDINKNITLPCAAVGKPPPTITWSRSDGRPIDFETGRVKQLQSGALFIHGVEKKDEGMYTCSIKNQFGRHDLSAFITVTGIVKPLIAYQSPNIESPEGKDVKLTCIVLLGNPPPKISWMKLGEPVRTSESVIDDGNGNLMLRGVRVEDEGEYTCVASNPGGSASHAIKLDVQVPPSIRDSPADLTVIQGHSIRLPCEVSGDPKPQITWTKNGIRISEVDPHYFISEAGSLEIFSADSQDTATYSCSAINVAGVKEKRVTLFVQIPPVMSQEHEEITVIVNNPVQLLCEVSGLPPPTIAWRKAGSNTDPSKNEGVRQLPSGALRIERVQVKDGGVYECMGTNVAGSATKIITLNVQVPPQLQYRAESTIIRRAGEEVVLPCEVTGDPRPEVEWRKDQVKIDFYNMEHKYYMKELGSLIIPRVEVKDAARYLCIGENPAGVVKQEITLIVIEPPHLPKEPEREISIIENNRVTLPCPVRGTPQPTIRWFKGETLIRPDGPGVALLPDGSLQLDKVEAKDAGKYYCLAENSAGNLSVTIDLNVYMPPRFADGDIELTTERRSVIQDHTTRLSCPVHAVPPPQITWYRDGTEVKEQELPRIRLLDGGRVLELSKAHVDDQARYTCVARNLAGETEKNYDLDVHVPPRLEDYTSSNETLSVIIDRPVIIDCPVTGIPPPEVIWFKEGRQVFPDQTRGGIRVLSGGQRLEISNAEVGDTGKYKCVAKNSAGHVERDYKLNVWIPAKIDTSDTISLPEVMLSMAITMHCPASGIPTPEVSWFRDAEPILHNTSSVTVLDNGWRLRISNAEVTHAARYSCRAKNVAGEAEKHFDLSVLVTPTIDRRDLITDPKVVHNRTLVINCPASGTPHPTIVWLKNGDLLDPLFHPNIEILAGGRQLRISSATVSDTATYRCLASNKAGKDSVDFKVAVQIPTNIDRTKLDFYPTVIVNNTRILECPAIGIPPPRITWYKNGRPMTAQDFKESGHLALHQDGGRMEIRTARVDDAARYECHAENDAGQDRISYDLKVLVPPQINIATSTTPRPQVILGATVVIHCDVTGISTPSIQWMSNGQPLDASNPRYRLLSGGRSLEISSSEVSDTGSYTCIAKNEAGVADRDFDLEVLVPPYIDITDVDLNPKVIKGKVALLHCPVQGIPFPNITWYKDNHVIQENSRTRILLSGRQLEISQTEEFDSGRFICEAVNTAGQARQAFNLSVLVPPAIDEANIVDNPKIIVNRTVLLECPVAGIPPPKVKWMKDGEGIRLRGGMQLVAGGRHLEISRAEVSDTARYTCVATNEAGELRRNFDLEVLVPATILGETTVNVEVVENHTVYMDCPSDGIPPPSLLWFKDNTPLLDIPYANVRELSGGKQLEMRDVKVGDQGEYRCQVSNVAGQSNKKFNLKVLVPPRIEGSRMETDMSVVKRRSTRFECDVTGVPEPVIAWLKDGEEMDLERNPNFRLMRSGRVLQLVAAEPEHTGVYTCEAKNVAGVDRRRYNLEVQVPPSISKSHLVEEQSVVIGGSTELICEADGTPQPVFTWMRDGQSFTFQSHPNLRQEGGGGRLVVTNAQLVDIGGYTCVASNEAGNSTKEYLINVQVPPTIEEGASEVAATVDSRAILMCNTLGLPKPEVRWERDGKPIPPSGPSYTMHRTGSLQFTSVRVEEGGTYRCIAENEAGSAHRDIRLTVQVPPQIDQQGPLMLRATLGEVIELPCRVTGTPKPRIMWQKGTKMVADLEGYTLQDNGSLKIDSVDVKDAGIYICVAQNNAGTALSQVRMEVQVPPSIDSPVKEFTIAEGREVTFPCRAQGVPSPKITWERNGQPISRDDYKYRISRSGWLTVVTARVGDAGDFTCVAENEAGKASTTLNLVVHVPPAIEMREREQTVTVGDKARLSCAATGVPTPKISWIQDGRTMLSSEGRHEIQESGALIITNVLATDAGSYVCTAKNSAGRDSKEVTLKVNVPPTFTLIPRDLEVNANGRIELECVAEGVPTPVITWKINGTDFNVSPSINGRGRLIIDDAQKRDDATYMCVAENIAGVRRAIAAVRVKVPPKVLIQSENQAVSISERILLDCPVVGGDPPPTIFWTKNSQPVELNSRVTQLPNGSLAIYDSGSDDAGEYKCVATNDAGSSEGVAHLTVRVRPEFRIEPFSQTVDQGTMVLMNCVADGEPKPDMSWRRGKDIIVSEDRVNILANNSLRIVAARLSDSGTYICMARNSMGSVLVSAELTVQVHGGYSGWSSWSSCSATCNEGSRSRSRTCDSPSPANGGRPCSGPDRETMSCNTQPCPVDGGWSDWLGWDQCSQSCGSGFKTRTRDCNNPAPYYGGRMCQGDAVERVRCNERACPIDGGWNAWSAWTPCSETCGEGTETRYRRCDHPSPAHGGRECLGPDTETRTCRLAQCEVNGGWGDWSEWSQCTLSCGGGTRMRKRLCDSPAPSSGGRFCPGSDIQIDYCNKDDCPVHGQWSPWSPWGDCTVTCGGGLRRRFRTCNNPPPKHNGRDCLGSDQETDMCNTHQCAVDGEWGEWSDWGGCSRICDGGYQERTRVCRKPLFGGAACAGDASQRKKCNQQPCKASPPSQAQAQLKGRVNEREFGSMRINATIIPNNAGTRVNAAIINIPPELGHDMQTLLSILTPIYWTTAQEVGGAVNGFTLTGGKFQRKVQVEFATGEVLKMEHIAKGVNHEGVLDIDVMISGALPRLPPHSNINVLPYTEDYIQTGPGSIYAHSSRLFRVDGHTLPYAWNHSITYDPDLGRMPFLVQRLSADDVFNDYDEATRVLRYQLSATIARGEPSNQCPKGFTLDPNGPYCKDDDECMSRMSPCSHNCHNSMGGFFCSCPPGLTLDPTGRSCTDVDECSMHTDDCSVQGRECVNTIGSYVCDVTCGPGLRRSTYTNQCEDIDECLEHGSNTRLCEHDCSNTHGSYQCSCRSGYRLLGAGRCEDIDECLEGRHNCRVGEQCKNSRGGFTCISTCPSGYSPDPSTGTCVDIDECRSGHHECKYNQVCVNNAGGYTCTCPRGYRSPSPGQPCADIDECSEPVSPCSHKCTNTRGGYECSCPPGHQLLADKRSCAGIEYLDQAAAVVGGSVGQLVPLPTRCPNQGNGRLCPQGRGNMCPRGYSYQNGRCIDVDECKSKVARCQHGCVNKQGSYECTCPEGYRLSPNRHTCVDIDECKENRVTCAADQRCFNKRGDYECIDITCPDDYTRDPTTGYCIMDCQRDAPSAPSSCPPGNHYKQILEFHMVALPSGIPAYQDLIRLLAYDQENVHLPQTTFTIMDKDPVHVPFDIRLQDGKGVVYTLQPLQEQRLYKIKVEARSLDHRRAGVEYHTIFMIYISVSRYPY